MRDYIEVIIDDETNIKIELADSAFAGGDDPLVENVASGGKVIKKAKDFLDSSLEQINIFSNSIAHSIKNSKYCPDEFELEFAVKFGADAGIIISTVSTEANVTVKMKWVKGD